MTTEILKDARPDVMGLSFTLDEERFANAKVACGMSPEQTVIVKITTLPESDIAGKTSTAAGVLWNAPKPTLLLPVQDRLDFSEKSLARVNRSLVQGLRVLAARTMLMGFYSGEYAAAFMVGGSSLIYGEAYEFARDYVKDQPDHVILTPVGAPSIEEIPTDEEDGEE